MSITKKLIHFPADNYNEINFINLILVNKIKNKKAN